MVKNYLVLFSFFIFFNALSQQANSIRTNNSDLLNENKSIKKQERLKLRQNRKHKKVKPYNALAPTLASFYSAILPGLGQAYTGKYWKIPIVYGALGTGIGITLRNNRKANEFREIYKNRLLGIYTDKYWGQTSNTRYSNEVIASQFEKHEKNKELSILITICLYALNIIDANITAHLQQYNISDNISFKPYIEIDDSVTTSNYGLGLSYSL